MAVRCEDCDKGFRSKRALRCHKMRLRHGGVTWRKQEAIITCGANPSTNSLLARTEALEKRCQALEELIYGKIG